MPTAMPGPSQSTSSGPKAGALIALLFLLTSNVSNLAGWYRGTPPLHLAPDNGGVLSQMAESARGGLVYQNPYAPTGSPQVSTNPFFVLGGLLIRAAGLSPPAAFHVLRLLGTLAVALLALSLSRGVARGATLAALLALFASGTAPFVATLERLRPLPAGWWKLRTGIPEATPLDLCATYAHHPAALALLLATHLAVLSALAGSRRAPWAAAACQLTLSFVHPFDTVGVLATAGAYALVLALRGELTRAVAARLAPVVAAPWPAIAYYGYLSFAYPDLANRVHIVQRSPAALLTVGMMGFTILAGFLAWVSEPQGGGPSGRYLRTWLVAQLLCCFGYPVVPFERRLTMGCVVPAALLAAPWITALWGRGGTRRAGAALLVALCVGGTPAALVLALFPEQAGKAARVSFRPRDAVDERLDDVLARHLGADDVVLSMASIGVHIPWMCAARPFAGYRALTPGFDAKDAIAQRFFSRGTPDAERDEVLWRHGVTFVLQAGAGEDLARPGILERVATAGGYRLYRVDRRRLTTGGAAP